MMTRGSMSWCAFCACALIASSSAIAQGDFFWSFNDLNTGATNSAAIGNLDVGDTAVLHLYYTTDGPSDLEVQAAASLCVATSVSGVIEFTGVEVLNPAITVGAVPVNQRWTVVVAPPVLPDRIDGFGGVSIGGGSPGVGMVESSTGPVFVDQGYDANANAFLFARVSVQVVGAGTVDIQTSGSVDSLVVPVFGVAAVHVVPPSGNECVNAARVGNETVLGSLSDNTGSTGDDSSCALGAGDTIDEWYAYTALGDGTLTVSTCNPGTDFDTVLSAFDACPENGDAQIACNDDAAGVLPECSHAGVNRLSIISFAVEEKLTYFIRVSATSDDLTGLGGVGNFELTFDGPTVSLWDECEVARAVTEGSYHGTLLGNTGSTGNDSSCGGSRDTIDEWYAYTASGDGTVRVTTCLPGTEFDTVLSAFDACDGTELACNDDTVGAPTECALGVNSLNLKSTVEMSVASGQTSFIRVSASADSFTTGGRFGTNYDLSITLLCPCDWNSDANLNAQDFFDWVNDYFAQTGPQGQYDFNNDTFQNAQDFFDFVNCYFTPPAACP